MAIKSYKIRLLPTPEQEQLMFTTINASRFVWNWGLAYQMERFKNNEKHLSDYDMKKVLTQAKKEPEHQWLADISSQTLSMALLDLGTAYKRFFKVQKNGEKYTQQTIANAKRHERNLTPYDMNGHPKFKKKAKSKQSFYSRYNTMYFTESGVMLEKIGKVKYQTNYELPVVNKRSENTVKFINPRVSYVNGKWILSVGMECENQAQELNDFAIGIDLGVTSLAVISHNGKKGCFENINKTDPVRKLKKRLRHYQRKLSRKYRQNGNYEKTKRILKTQNKINEIYRKLANIRLNYIHHVTTEIVNLLPKTIVVEDLNISGMMKNRHLAKAIQEQLLGEFLRQIEYKCAFNGIKLIKADRFYPSSKLCCKCGNKKKDLKLRDRYYNCSKCGNRMDRDENASENLEKLAS